MRRGHILADLWNVLDGVKAVNGEPLFEEDKERVTARDLAPQRVQKGTVKYMYLMRERRHTDGRERSERMRSGRKEAKTIKEI